VIRQVEQCSRSSGLPHTKQSAYALRGGAARVGASGADSGRGGGRSDATGGTATTGGVAGDAASTAATAGALAADSAGSTSSDESGAGVAGVVSSDGLGSGVSVSVFGASSGSRRSRRKNDIRDASRNGAIGVALHGPARFSGPAGSPGVPPTPSERLRELGIELPPPPTPVGTYLPVVSHGGFAYVSGQVVTEAGAAVRPGLVDRDVPKEVAKDLARRASLQALSALAAALGSLDRVKRFVRVTVYVATSPGFDRQHEVANGATEVLVEIFGENGRPARAAIGMAGLPLNAPVEVEYLVATE
jgi:enamine deaminase RidA (YjgF/YER057c/UK114 family)